MTEQRAGSEPGLHFTTSTESQSHNSLVSAPALTFTVPPHPLLGAPQLLPVAAPAVREHEQDPFTRRASTANHVSPGTAKHNSAPISTSASTAPMTDAAIAPRMYHSFAAMDAPGDTQPDSQMHRDWTSGIFGTAETTTRMPSPRSGPKSLFTEHDDPDDVEPLTDGLQFVESSQIQQDAIITSPTALEDDRSPYLRTEQAFTSPLKFETPAVAGRKRDISGHMLSSTAAVETTPDTLASASASASAFGGEFGRSGIGQPLSLTQAFDLTQARTSPIVAGAEDPIFQRPSPNFNNVRHSSPIPALSSPIKVMRNERSDPIVRSSSEPRSEYVTMKESQERRKHTKAPQRVTLVQEDSWEELTAAQKRMQRQKQKEQSHREAGLSLSNISAPANDKPRVTRKRKENIQRPPTIQHNISRHTWHDGVQEDEDVAMNDASQHLAPKGEEADHSPDELSEDAALAEQAPMRYPGLDTGVQVPKTSSHPQRTQPEHAPGNGSYRSSPSSQRQRESQIQAPASQSVFRAAPQSSRGSVAIMDSQPDITVHPERLSRPPDLSRFPSSPSINQYSINQTTLASKTGYTSQMISSSMIQMPPQMSPEAGKDVEDEETPEEEERVPSSPPILTDELTYDEHTYDEHPDGDEVDEVAAGEEDAHMEDEDELPVATPELADTEGVALEAGKDKGNDAESVQSYLVQPMKVDAGIDQEIPETLKENRLDKTDRYNATKPFESVKAEGHPGAVKPTPSLQRQTTIPETDTLDETQPSYFMEEGLAVQEEDSPAQFAQCAKAVQEDAEPFETAQEQRTTPQSCMLAPASSRDEGSDPNPSVSRIRSLHDIANLPATQLSAAEEEIEIPCLSGFDDADGDTRMTSSVSASPATKRRKTAHITKSSVFRSPTKTVAVLEEQAPPLPPKQIQQTREDTPPTASAQGREEQGALAAAQAREDVQMVAYGRPAALKSRASSGPAKPQNSKKGSLKSARAVIATMSSPINSPSKPNAPDTARRITPTTPSRKIAKPTKRSIDVEMRDAGESADELASSPPPSATRLPVRPTPRKLEAHSGEVVVPNRVFASWPGSHFYPATCLGRSDSKQLQVRFDDGNTTSLDAFQVRSLDLRPGDQVKVDEPGLKKHTYVVVHLGDKCNDLENYEYPMTDRYGHVTATLEEKQRDSLPTAKTPHATKQISVHIASIYLTTQLWGRLRDRAFRLSAPPSPSKSASRLDTPTTTEALTTPSFTRRGLAAPSLLKDATNRAGSVASSRSGGGTFSNMAFVLTSTGDGMDKDAVARAIKTNGGRVLEQGFHELFDTQSIEISASQSRRTSVSTIDEAGVLGLKEEYRKLGFVALITDSHSRSTKYLQALALNVPCLHLRWVNDSLSASRALSFARYLLPAGVSKYLDPNGIVRSRAIRVYDPSSDSVSFEQTFEARDLLLKDQSVLLVTGKSKKEIEKRQPFVFLTHALGSANIGRCADLAAATQLLAHGTWDWVYVDSEQSSLADAAAELFGAGAPAKSAKSSFKKGKKRKRDDGDADELLAKGELSGRRIRIASAEFVIQSLILGALVDE
ncbi:radiation sensitive protein rad9 [Ascochyta clinopodiicola]|nr:radiation sensitive protein rad9 [Ascochyta clinopodiicola]